MESNQQKSRMTTFGKLIIVGTVAAVCAVATLFSGSTPSSGVNFVDLAPRMEVE